uniref:Ion_trans domain-containing protein n=1 Tax=Steinernema glaseri TaxID=37863 RepID=A0A1I7YNX9_9BILA
MPEFQRDNSQANLYHLMHQKSTRDFSNKPQKFIPVVESENATSSFVYKPTDDPANFLVVLEYICIAWFSVEYALRLLISPRKRLFVFEPMNLIDLCTILPFYLEVGFGWFGMNLDRLHNITGDDLQLSRKTKSWIGAMLVIRVLRVLRMARVFKLARYSTGLQIFGHTLRSSLTELSMLGMFLLTGIVFFSTLIYFIEKDEQNTEFSSIPSACWWCVVTMTTIGYGDSIPKTSLGKVIATSASVCGIIVLAFPISMIVEKFACAQQKAHEESQIRQAHMAVMAQNYFLNRFTRRRKACKEPLASSVHAKLNGQETPIVNGSARSIA